MTLLVVKLGELTRPVVRFLATSLLAIWEGIALVVAGQAFVLTVHLRLFVGFPVARELAELALLPLAEFLLVRR